MLAIAGCGPDASAEYDPGCVDTEPDIEGQTPFELASGIEVGYGMGGIAVRGADAFFTTDESRIMRTATTGAAPQDLLIDAVRTRGLTIDGEYLYWAAGDYDSGQLRRMPVAGGQVESLGRARSFSDIEKMIAFDETYVYWTDFDLDDASIGGRIMRVAKTGGEARPLVEGRPGIPFSIATDGSEIFWSEGASLDSLQPARIMTMATAGGDDVREVTQLSAGAGDLAVDQSTLYFGTSADDAAALGVYRVSKAGGTPQRIAPTDFMRPLHVILDDTHVYWAAEGVAKATKDGCAVTVLLEGVDGSCTGITTDANNVYYTNGHLGGNTGMVLRLDK